MEFFDYQKFPFMDYFLLVLLVLDLNLKSPETLFELYFMICIFYCLTAMLNYIKRVSVNFKRLKVKIDQI